MKPTEDVSQFPEKGMKTPETKLTVETTDAAYQPDSLLSFNHANREIFRITHDGRMICGEGLSMGEATQEAAKLLIASFEEQIQEMVDIRIAAMQNENRYFKTCAELAAIAARAEEAKAELTRLRALSDQLSDNLSAVGAAYNDEKARAEKAEAALAASRYEAVHWAQEGLRECIRAEKAEFDLARAHDIINRASVQFFHDGSDGETAAKMLTVLNEAKA
jgi:uncharacterized protein YccT (UPF0319 family)